MKKIGLVLDNWGPSDVGFDAIYSVERAPRDVDITGFYLNPSRACLAPRFSIQESYLSYAYEGALVATSLSSADRVIKAATSTDRYFYIWNLEWLNQPVPFEVLHKFMTELKLIARSPEIAYHLEKVWGVKVEVAKNFKELWGIVNG